MSAELRTPKREGEETPLVIDVLVTLVLLMILSVGMLWITGAAITWRNVLSVVTFISVLLHICGVDLTPLRQGGSHGDSGT